MAFDIDSKMFFGATHLYIFNKDIASSETIINARKNELKDMKLFCIYERPNEEGFLP